ncbi:MAG: hypothetical protein ABSB91_04905 [Sedimentisphaerales bacterium]
MCRKLVCFIVAALLGSQAMAAVEVNSVSFPALENISSWPQPFTDTSAAVPSAFAQVENNYGSAPYSLAQSWTATTSGSLSRIQLLISGTAPVSFKINLYDAYVWDGKENSAGDWSDIGSKEYKPGGNVSKNLFSSTLPVTWTGFTNQGDQVGVLEIVLTGSDMVPIEKGHQYIFEITSDSDIKNMMWYRNASSETNYSGGQAFRQASPLNGNAARDFAAAFTVGVAVPAPAPAPAKPAAPQTKDVNAKDVNAPATK